MDFFYAIEFVNSCITFTKNRFEIFFIQSNITIIDKISG
jgi:hypothetical protein